MKMPFHDGLIKIENKKLLSLELGNSLQRCILVPKYKRVYSIDEENEQRDERLRFPRSRP